MGEQSRRVSSREDTRKFLVYDNAQFLILVMGTK